MYNIDPTLLSDSVFRSSVLTYFGTYKQSDSILKCGWLSYIPCLIWLIFSCKIHQIQRVVLDSLQTDLDTFGEFWTVQNFLICLIQIASFMKWDTTIFSREKLLVCILGSCYWIYFCFLLLPPFRLREFFSTWSFTTVPLVGIRITLPSLVCSSVYCVGS